MELNAWLTLGAVFISPIVAVLITLWIDGRRRDREGKLHVVRMLMATRHLPADPAYSTAINLLRVEFAKSQRVMAEYAEYHRLIRRESATTPEGVLVANKEILSAQTKLLSAVLSDVGMPTSEADLAIEGYAAGAFIDRDNLYLDSLRAQIRTADALEKSIAE